MAPMPLPIIANDLFSHSAHRNGPVQRALNERFIVVMQPPYTPQFNS